MGNTVGKNNCCSNQFGHNKKEVDIDQNENIKLNGEPPIDKRGRETSRDHRYAAPPPRQDQKPEIKPVEVDTSRDLERIKRLEQIVASAPVLSLKVVNSTMLPKGTVIRINAQGIEGSLRNRKDGITYFGCKKKSKPLDPNLETPEVINDYIIRNKDSETNDRHRGRHFQIEFNTESNTFKIRDLGVGFGAFVKIEHPLLLRDNNLLSMGSSFLIVNLDEEGGGAKESLMYSNSALDLQEKLKEARLSRQSPFSSPLEAENKPKQSANGKKAGVLSQEITVKIFGGPNYGEVYQFNSNIPVIRIGRMPDCEVRIEDSLLSKYQGSIKYVQDSGWFLYDGLNGKPSTNSNWLYLNDDFEMYDGMVFKANHTLFQVGIEKE